MFQRDLLKKYIDEGGIKQKAVAEKAGLTENAFCLLLSGKRECKIEEYIRICQALLVPFDKFIDPTDTRTTKTA